MLATDWIAIAAIIAPVVGGVIIWLVTLSNRVGRLETKVEVFWKAVSIDAAKILHSPHLGRERLDQLIDVYVNGTITKDEVVELKWSLHDIVDNKITPCTERMLASMLMRVLDARFGTYMEGRL